MKGCPLRCKWCSNPETWTIQDRLFYVEKKCINCGKCETLCPKNAIGSYEAHHDRIDRALCDVCGTCVNNCLQNAFRISGKEYTTQELFYKIERDVPFYGDDGGLTISGGEALSQAAFTEEMFRLCKENNIGTVLDTCAYGNTTALERILDYTDLVLLDLKHMDSNKHEQWTGKPNNLILKNAVKIMERVETRISIPLIPTVNNDRENLHRTAEFAASYGVKWIDINPFHALGEAKYQCLGMASPYFQFRKLKKQEIEEAIRIIKSHGLQVTVGRMM